MGLGEELRRAREEQGISLREAEEATKIRLRYLKALEDEEFHLLPGRVYALGFLRVYAHYLGLDAERLVEQLKARYLEENLALPLRREPLRKRLPLPLPKRKRSYGRLLVLLVLLCGLLLLYFFYYPYPAGEREVAPGAREVAEEVLPPAPAVQGVEVVIKAERGDCWLGVWEGEKQVFSGTLRLGETKSFRGEKSLTVKLGNAGGVRVIFNNQDLGFLGSQGEVVTREFRAP